MVGLRGAQILCLAAAVSVEGERGWGCCCQGPWSVQPRCSSQVRIYLAPKPSRVPISSNQRTDGQGLFQVPFPRDCWMGAQADRHPGNRVKTQKPFCSFILCLHKAPDTGNTTSKPSSPPQKEKRSELNRIQQNLSFHPDSIWRQRWSSPERS